MALIIKHGKVATIPDDPGVEIGSTEWNDDHVLTATGLTPGHFLKATGATTFDFAVHGLTASDVGAPSGSGSSTGTNTGDSATPAETTTTIGALINGATAKDSPVDADQLGLMDSAGSNILKKLSWAYVKSVLKTYFDGLYAVTGKGVTNGDSHDHDGGDGAQIDHTKLSNIGTNAHSAIDTFISSKATASGLASLDGSSLVVQNPANATATATASKIPIAESSGKLAAEWLPYEYGAVLSNNSSDANNDLDISAGALLDSTGVRLMTLAAITKRFDASWAAGTGNGGMRSGLTKSASTWYFVYIIEDVGTAVDVIADTSNSGPTLPSGYDYWQLIGAFKTDGSANILKFWQTSDGWFYWDTYPTDFSGTGPTSFTDLTISSPPVAGCLTLLMSYAYHATLSAVLYWRRNGSADATGLLLCGTTITNYVIWCPITVAPDASSIIEWKAIRSSVTSSITTQAFRLPRRGLL
jgi:hypothetical protein